MSSKLGRIEGLSRAWLAIDTDFEGLKTAFLAEFILDALDVGGKSSFAMPLETTLIGFSFFGITVTFATSAFGDKNL